VVREESYDEGWTTGVEAGIERGAYSKAIETAKRCLEMKMLPDTIAELTGLTESEIEQLK